MERLAVIANTLAHNNVNEFLAFLCTVITQLAIDVSPVFNAKISMTMDANLTIEQRLETIERLLRGQKAVLNFEEACEFTNLSPTYMYKLTCGNKIPYFKPHGKQIYFSREELERWLMKNPVKTTEQKEQEAINYVTRKRR